MSRAIFVETRVCADLDRLWEATQDPGNHERWDLRFQSITYLESGAAGDGVSRGFRYALRVLPGLTINGTGRSAGERIRPDETRTSALRFSSSHPLSLIREGSGWWRYVPAPNGTTRFLTGYDYTPGWGRVGPLADVLFRPLLGWATAWSFDRLRLWLDEGINPEAALAASLRHQALRATLVGAAVVASRRTPALGLALLLSARWLPRPHAAPVAGRCLRQPTDRLGRKTPSLMKTITG